MAVDVRGVYGPCAIIGLGVLEWLPLNSLTANNANTKDATMRSKMFGRSLSRAEPTGSRQYFNESTHTWSDAIE